jgi:hypothetical protein
MNELEDLNERVKSKAAELAATGEQLTDITSQLLDALPKARPALIAKRAELAALVDTLTAEYAVLSNRRDRALLDTYQQAEEEARAECERLTAIAKAKTAESDAANVAMTHFYNRPGFVGDDAGRDREQVRLSGLRAEANAERNIAVRDMNQARRVLAHAEAERAQMAQELGL